MSSRSELMKECAQTYLDHGDKRGHDAIMAAIDDPHQARQDYPDKKSDINNSIKYTDQELSSSGHSG